MSIITKIIMRELSPNIPERPDFLGSIVTDTGWLATSSSSEITSMSKRLSPEASLFTVNVNVTSPACPALSVSELGTALTSDAHWPYPAALTEKAALSSPVFVIVALTVSSSPALPPETRLAETKTSLSLPLPDAEHPPETLTIKVYLDS